MALSKLRAMSTFTAIKLHRHLHGEPRPVTSVACGAADIFPRASKSPGFDAAGDPEWRSPPPDRRASRPSRYSRGSRTAAQRTPDGTRRQAVLMHSQDRVHLLFRLHRSHNLPVVCDDRNDSAAPSFHRNPSQLNCRKPMGNARPFGARFRCRLLTWLGLPTRYGRWHTVYMRWSRWSKKGVSVKLFEGLQDMGMMPSGTAVGGLDSTSVPVHKHGAGALKKPAGKRSDGRAAD